MTERSDNQQDEHDQAGTFYEHREREEAVLAGGVELGNFRLEATLGRGGMGEVWKAYDRKAERFVVVKVVPEELRYGEEEMARVKETFGRIHALQHEHICPVYLLDEDDRFGWFVVMKYIDGQTLSAYRASYVARHGSFPLEQVVRVLRPVAEALDYAHSHKVIHRDVKPPNIMIVGAADDVQVVDFGLAAEIRTTLGRKSQIRMDTSGTLGYMAPEQWRGQYQDARADQYALGVVAYELLGGRLPFQGSDPEVLRLCVLNDAPPRLDDQPRAVNDVLSRALAKRRDERFGSCGEFVNSLEAEGAEEKDPEFQRLRAILSKLQRLQDGELTNSITRVEESLHQELISRVDAPKRVHLRELTHCLGSLKRLQEAERET